MVSEKRKKFDNGVDPLDPEEGQQGNGFNPFQGGGFTFHFGGGNGFHGFGGDEFFHEEF